jgi:hypothetical protein
MENVRRLRDLIKPQRIDQNGLTGGSASNDSLVVPYCSSGYSKDASGSVHCASGYSTNLWCVSKPSKDDDEVLF